MNSKIRIAVDAMGGENSPNKIAIINKWVQKIII